MRAVLLGTGAPPPNPGRRGPATLISLVAAGARAKQLVVTHVMPGSVPAELAGHTSAHLAGPVVVGEDLAEV